MSIKGQYTLGLFKLKNDNYEVMSVALKEISETLKNFKTTSINGVEYILKFSLGGDMAWIRTERGLNGCNSKFPCFKCLIPQNEFYKDYQIIDEMNLRSLLNQKIF